MTDATKKTCPTCKKKKLRRLIGAGGAIVFKGTGFYQTDYRSESYKKGAAADAPAKSSEWRMPFPRSVGAMTTRGMAKARSRRSCSVGMTTRVEPPAARSHDRA